ncbi:MAG: hypothetical protein MRK02_09250 [Candidatus Scalindua sp.]|nr:hypothetical protein [Candidatus Scalindua sp.]
MNTLRLLKTQYIIAGAFIFFLFSGCLSMTIKETFAGEIYYVAPGGNDKTGDGSIGRPWATLKKANSVVTAGDTVYCRGGLYPDHRVTWTAVGREGNPITIAAYPGETPKFEGSIKTPTFLLVDTSVDVGSLIFDGLSMRFYNVGLLLRRGGDFIIRNCTFRDIAANTAGAIKTGMRGYIVRNLTIENCYFDNIGRLSEVANDHSFYPSGKHKKIIVRNNYFKDSYGGPALNMVAGTSFDIYNNVFYSTKGVGRQAIYVAGTPSTREAFNICNNTFVIDPGGKGTTSWAISTRWWGGRQEDITIKNNIFYYTATKTDPVYTNYSKPNPIMDNNMYYNTTDRHSDKDDDDTSVNSFVGNPLFVNAGNGDFKLNRNSPAIDKGSFIGSPEDDYYGNPRPYGFSCDIGAFEASFSLSNSGNKSVSRGRSVTNTITSTLVSGTKRSISYSVTGLPPGAEYSFSPDISTPTLSSDSPTTLKISTSFSSTTPKGNYTITVLGTTGETTKRTSFVLTVM